MSFLKHKMEQHITETVDGEYTFGREDVFTETTSDRVVKKENGDKYVDIGLHGEKPYGIHELQHAVTQNPFLGCDYHIERGEEIAFAKNLNKYVDVDDHFIFLGDFDSRHSTPDFDRLKRFFANIKCRNVYLILGNNDSFPVKKYKELGIKAVVDKFEFGNCILTHFPVMVKAPMINIHGHLHGAASPTQKGEKAYWYADPKRCVDVWRDDFSPVRLNDVLANWEEMKKYKSYSDGKMRLLSEDKDGDEHMYFYHLVPKGSDVSGGIKSLDWFYKHDKKLFLKYSEKYRDRLVNAWGIYPNTSPEKLTAKMIYDGINKFRGTKDGCNQIYCFYYPPHRYLGEKMRKLLETKDIYRIDIKYDGLKKCLKSIDWGYEGSFTGNKKLSENWYKNCTYDDYFSKYDENVTPLFSTLNHISICTKDGVIPEKCLIKIENPEMVLTTESGDDVFEESVGSYQTKDITRDFIEKFKKNMKALSHIRTNENTKGVMLVDGENCIGFINTEIKDDGVWIQALEVSKEYQHQGYGQKLLEYAIKKLKATKLSVRKSNSHAIKLYKKNGFSVVDENDYQYIMSLGKTYQESEDENQFQFIDFKNPKAKSYLEEGEKSYWNKFGDWHIKNSIGEIVIDKENDKLAGYIFVDNKASGQEGFITPLMVIKRYRKNGLGNRLLEDAISKYRAIDLVVKKSNTIALNMYKKHGFVTIGKGNEKGTIYMKLKSKLGKDDQIIEESCKSLKEARELTVKVRELAGKYNANFYFVTDGASATSNRGNPAVKVARDAVAKWERNNGYNDKEDWSDNPDDTSDYMLKKESSDEVLSGEVVTEEANYNKRNIYPVYIILTDADSPMAKLIKSYTGQPYAHALISFNTDLEPAYSFGCTSIKPLKFGFISKSEEDPFRNEEKAAYVVYVMYVNKMQYTKIQDKLQWFMDNKDKMKYSWGGLLTLGLHIPKQFENQYFCSQFVMDLIGDAIKLPKDPSLWTPGDIEHLQNISLVDKGPDLRYFNKKRFKKNLKYIQKHQFNKMKYESVDLFSEATDSITNPNLSHYFVEKVGKRVDKVLSDPAKVKEFNNLVRNYINRNITKLTKSGPCDMIPFTDLDHKQFQEMFGFWYNITKTKETSPNEIREYIVEYSKLAHAKITFWLNNSSQVLFYFVIRYFTMHPDPKSLNAALSIYTLCIYPVMFHKYFPLGVMEPIMQYTIDNLTEKFLIKKSKHLFDSLLQSIQASYRFHKNNFKNASDKNVADWISRIRNDQNSMLKKISNEYMKNWKDGKAARTTNEEYDSDTPIIDELENGTTAVQNIVQKVTLPIIEEGVDLVRAEAAAKMAQVSISDCRYFLTLIITDSNADLIQKFIESILFLYIYEGKKTERDIRSTYFITWAASLFKKTNSKNPNINTINDILNTWSENSGINKKFSRIASRINYKKAIFYYLILCIQKHV